MASQLDANHVRPQEEVWDPKLGATQSVGLDIVIKLDHP